MIYLTETARNQHEAVIDDALSGGGCYHPSLPRLEIYINIISTSDVWVDNFFCF